MKVHPLIVSTKLGKLETVNFYLVEINDSLILIDAGNDDAACRKALKNTLKNIGKTFEDIDAILLTHHHSDHTGLVNYISTYKEILVYVHSEAFVRLTRDETFFQKRIAFYDHLYKMHGCGKLGQERVEQLKVAYEKGKEDKLSLPLHPIKEGDTLFGLEVIETPGHSPDQVSFYHAKEQIAFIGDHFIKHSPSNAIYDIYSDGSTFHSLLTYEASLKKLRLKPLQHAYSGHGHIINDVEATISDKLKRMEHKGQKILAAIEKPITAMELAETLYRDRLDHPMLFALIMSEIIGHLERLEKEQYVKKSLINDMLIYEQI